MEKELHFQRNVMSYIGKHEETLKKIQKSEEECGRKRTDYTQRKEDTGYTKRREFYYLLQRRECGEKERCPDGTTEDAFCMLSA